MYGVNAGDTYIPAQIDLKECSAGQNSHNSGRIGDNVLNRVGVSTVVDSRSGDMILKIANMLPVSISANLQGYPAGEAELTVISGQPRDRDVTPAVSEIEIDGSLEVLPYSFTTLRIKNKK